MKKLLIIGLVAVTIVLMAFHIIVYDATSGSPGTCEAHGLRMSKRTVALRWGMKPQSDTDTARSRYFPHADEPYESGWCLEPRQSRARVFVYPRCTAVRAAWLLSGFTAADDKTAFPLHSYQQGRV